MGDTKISEAAQVALDVLAAFREDYRLYIPQFHAQNRKRMKLILANFDEAIAALSAPHLQGDAVPVCFIPPRDAELLRKHEFSLVSMHSRWERPSGANDWVPVYLGNPQPASLNEVSGDSGELAEQQGDVREDFEVWASSNNYAIAKWPDGSYIEEPMRLAWKAWEHLAATGKQQVPVWTAEMLERTERDAAVLHTEVFGKQQVGEVQDARAQFEAWAHAQSYRGGNVMTDRDADHPDVYACPNAQLTWQCWKAALAARQPETDEQYADEQALIDHLDGLMDDGGQGGEKWAPARAAIAGILAACQPGAQVPAGLTGAFLSDVVTAAGLLSTGGQSKALAGRISDEAYRLLATLNAARPSHGIDLGQLWEPIKEAVHTALSAHVPAMSNTKRETIAVYVARQLRDGQRDAAPGVDRVG